MTTIQHNGTQSDDLGATGILSRLAICLGRHKCQLVGNSSPQGLSKTPEKIAVFSSGTLHKSPNQIFYTDDAGKSTMSI